MRTEPKSRPEDLQRTERTAVCGFTLVEVIIAILVLTMGVLAMAGTTGYVIRQITLANVLTERQVAFQSVVEQILAQDFDDVGAGSSTSGDFTVTWSSALDGAQIKIVTVIATGPGLAQGNTAYLSNSVADTFTFKVLRQ